MLKNGKLIISYNEQQRVQLYNKNDKLSDVIENAGIKLDLQCGGIGVCGKCRVVLTQGTFLISEKEVVIEKNQTRSVLSCITKIISNTAEINVPKISVLKEKGKIAEDFVFNTVTSKNKGLKLAVDIGTTTIALIVIDGETGAILSRASSYNNQMSKGDDVSARISYANNNDKLQIMQRLVIQETINKLIIESCDSANVNVDNIKEVAISANTVMSHLFCGISPESIGKYPFTPKTLHYKIYSAKDLDLNVNNNAEIYIVPSISGYLGGDVISDIFISNLSQYKKCSLMIDLGTNSEMVLAQKNKLYATSAAAGPAFEGAGLYCGCRATTGAIDTFQFDNTLNFKTTTIEDSKAIGICGSGIIDFVANGYKTSLINKMGRFNIDLLKECNRLIQVTENNNKLIGCKVIDKKDSGTGTDIVITESDIEQVLKAKGAIYAGIKTLLSQQYEEPCKLNKIILSGGFAKYINIENAITIGMLPKLNLCKYEIIGNGSLAGAYISLQQREVRDTYNEIVEIPKVIELNQDPTFEMNYIDALLIPNYNEDEF